MSAAGIIRLREELLKKKKQKKVIWDYLVFEQLPPQPAVAGAANEPQHLRH